MLRPTQARPHLARYHPAGSGGTEVMPPRRGPPYVMLGLPGPQLIGESLNRDCGGAAKACFEQGGLEVIDW
jgi:hypothetical protein